MEYDGGYEAGYDGYEGYAARFAPGPDDCEDLETYQEAGYHPVLIGDEFCDGKYSVVHKLGHGGNATVWLATAQIGDRSRYVALKIVTAAHSSQDCNELKIHEHLKKKAQEGCKLASLASLLDSFWIDGPNGRHICFVFEVSGPSLASLRFHWGLRKIRPDVARSLALQLARGVRELHDAGVIYGDLSPNNLLFRLVDIDSWTVDELYERFGHPKPFELQTSDGGPVPGCAPKFVFEPIQFHEVDLKYFKPELMFIDLADGRLVEDSTSEQASGYSIGYAAPETLFFKEQQRQAADTWSLACIWFEMRSATQLFEESSGAEFAIQDQIIDAIGPLPPSWVERLPQEEEAPEFEEAREEVTEQLQDTTVDIESQSPKPESMRSIRSKLRKAWKWIKGLFVKLEVPDLGIESSQGVAEQRAPQDDHPDIPEYFRPKEDESEDASLHAKIQNIGHWMEWHYLPLEERVRRVKEFYHGWSDKGEKTTIADVDHEPPPGPLPEDERVDFEDLLSSIFKYEKEERMALKDIVDHPWLNKTYGEAGSDPWLKKYHPGVELQVITL